MHLTTVKYIYHRVRYSVMQYSAVHLESAQVQESRKCRRFLLDGLEKRGSSESWNLPKFTHSHVTGMRPEGASRQQSSPELPPFPRPAWKFESVTGPCHHTGHAPVACLPRPVLHLRTFLRRTTLPRFVQRPRPLDDTAQ